MNVRMTSTAIFSPLKSIVFRAIGAFSGKICVADKVIPMVRVGEVAVEGAGDLYRAHLQPFLLAR